MLLGLMWAMLRRPMWPGIWVLGATHALRRPMGLWDQVRCSGFACHARARALEALVAKFVEILQQRLGGQYLAAVAGGLGI